MNDASKIAACIPDVLVVDDNPDNLQLLCGMLKKSGFRARPVPSGALALEAAANSPPDLILLDISMPEMDGYEVCRRLKREPKLSDIPVIFISAMGETTDKIRGFSAGGVDYVTKPFQLEEVEVRVRTHIEIQRQKRQLQESYDRLRQVESLRDSLVHMIVHDMRSPLMGIGTCLEVLEATESGRLSEGARQLLGEARTTTGKLLEMVGSLLDVSKMESKAMQLKVDRCSVSELVEGAIGKTEALRGRRRVVLDLSNGPRELVCDGSLIQRVLQNLLNNAYQFSPDESEIRLGAEIRGPEVRFFVRDHGPGVPQEHREKIFEKFWQDEARQERRRFTTGLGLAFCKLAVETHGGRIGVDSEVSAGSTFWFDLPAQVPEGC